MNPDKKGVLEVASETVSQRRFQNLLGDLTGLLEQVGRPPELIALAPALNPKLIRDTATLQKFLEAYIQRLLVPIELPAIARAWTHASRGETRELIALDRELTCEPLLTFFATASKEIGQVELAALRPMRDQRVVQRYWTAIESGQAQGWHTLVYGLTLFIYSMPLRQGLCHYAEQTMFSLADIAARRVGLPANECRDIAAKVMAELPASIEKTLAPQESPFVAVR
ncbi:MAG: urease accessory UreF family protein [Limisphaerales bacterium]